MSTGAQKSRQARAQAQLERQLKIGTKNTKDGEIKLTDQDVKRIEKEINTLKTKR